jgi:hypothetical protein
MTLPVLHHCRVNDVLVNLKTIIHNVSEVILVFFKFNIKAGAYEESFAAEDILELELKHFSFLKATLKEFLSGTQPCTSYDDVFV